VVCSLGTGALKDMIRLHVLNMLEYDAVVYVTDVLVHHTPAHTYRMYPVDTALMNPETRSFFVIGCSCLLNLDAAVGIGMPLFQALSMMDEILKRALSLLDVTLHLGP
jgi:hypothetical protein